MSNLLYRFAVCSDVHLGTRSSDGITPMKDYEDALRNRDIDAVFCCGDVVYGNSGMYQRGSNVQERLSDARSLISHLAQDYNGLVCSGNHEAGNSFGLQYYPDSPKPSEGIDLWLETTGYSGYNGVENGEPYVDKCIQTMEKDGDFFISITSNGAGLEYAESLSKYNTDTIRHAESIIDEAIAAGKRVFVFTHFPYSSTRNEDGTYTVTAANAEVDPDEHNQQFGLHCTWSNGLVPQPVYPYSGNNNMLNMLKEKNILWFSGHLHNPWQISHPDGCILKSGNTTARAKYPFAHDAQIPNGARMINLPSYQYCLQDAVVYVYDDKVEVVERQAEQCVWSVDPSLDIPVLTSQDGVSLSTLTFTELLDENRNPRVHTWDVHTGEITTYTATFIADEVIVEAVQFPAGATSITEPPVPEKAYYTGEWEHYVLADADITIYAVYTAVEPSGGATLWGIGDDGQPVRYDGITVLYGMDGEQATVKVYDMSGEVPL